MMNKTILIVEDHREFRKAVCDFLKLNDVTAKIVEASSGPEAILLARAMNPRLILMDFWLGGMNGLQAATQIKQIVPHTAIIMLSMFDAKEIPKVHFGRVIRKFICKSELTEKLVPEIIKIIGH